MSYGSSGLLEEATMKSFIIACVAALVIAICGALVLNAIQEPSSEAYTSASSVRI
jgi:ABC-type uncharacterized transport system permease subunit